MAKPFPPCGPEGESGVDGEVGRGPCGELVGPGECRAVVVDPECPLLGSGVVSGLGEDAGRDRLILSGTIPSPLCNVPR